MKQKIKDKRIKRPKVKRGISYFSEHKNVGIIVLQIIFTLLLFFTIIDNIEPKKVKVRIGDVSPYEIRATKDIEDKGATQKLKNEAMERVEPRFRVNPSVQMKMKNDIRVFFGLVKDVKAYDNMSNTKKANLLEEQSNIKLQPKYFNIAVRIDNKELNSLENAIYDIINQIMSTGIKEEELEYEMENVKSIFKTLDMSKEEKELGMVLIESTIEPNKFLDMEATQRKKLEVAENVEPVIVKENQVIVRKGDRIDVNAYEMIKDSGLLKEKEGYDLSTIIGTIIIILLVESVIGLYLYHFNKEVFTSSKLVILDIIIISIVLISEGVYSISPYIMPVSTAAMLITLIINPKLALIINAILAFLIGIILKVDESVVAMLLIGGSIGAFSVINASQRYNIFFNGLVVGIVNVLTIVSFGLVKRADILDTLIKSGYGVLNGIFCAVLTIGTLPLWENVFQILTPLKLLELSNPNQPLLKKLLMEAPGTYHHSVLVGNLSEAAAEEVGANPLIARVGAYYHDIGKLKRPYLFKENQFGFDNPHDKLNPSLSTLIITNHTKDGLTMAEEYNLPKEIKDIIIQHHGDTIVAYFYYKALKGENSENVKIEDFRYKGPRPQTKEAAIIMLADSVEAAVRSIKEPNKGKIEEMVRNIIKGKLEDGQLEECDLTLKDLNTIANIFCTVLLGIFHDRIEYPKLDINEVKGEIKGEI